MDPEKFGGSIYGEKIWMTGATSDAVGAILGPDANNCGSDNGGAVVVGNASWSRAINRTIKIGVSSS
jgi:hypothetical protein